MAPNITMRIDCNTESLIIDLCSALRHEDLIQFISDLDDESQDWDFTIDLLAKLTDKIYKRDAEFINLDESYHEKMRSIIKKMKSVTLAPLTRHVMTEED